MSLQVEKLEKNMAKLTVEVPAEQFVEAIGHAYNKNKSKFNVPGFRKGKVPQAMIEKLYGPEVFYEEAANEVISATYGDAAKESGLDIVSRPAVDLVQIEKGKNFIYTAEVAVKPEVTLGQYKGVEVEKASAEVTDEDVEKELKKTQEQNSRLVTVEDRPVADGDQVVIDFDGYVDGKRFDGGQSEDYPLTIGSHTFIDTFEDQLIGKNLGEECEVNVNFPQEYHAAELAGKPAAGEVSEFETLDEYKADIRKKLTESKEKQAATENENRVVDAVVAGASMEIPEPMVDSQLDNMVSEYARNMQSHGISLEQYMQYTGMTVDKLKEQMRPQAMKRIQTRLVLEAVAKAENIQISDEKVDEEIAKMAEAYKMEPEKLKGYMGEAEIASMKEDLAVQEAVDFLVAEAKLS